MSLEIVNLVGSSDLHAELDLNELADDLFTPYIEYDPSNYHGLYVRILRSYVMTVRWMYSVSGRVETTGVRVEWRMDSHTMNPSLNALRKQGKLMFSIQSRKISSLIRGEGLGWV